MGTVRVERCPECRVLLGEGTLYEHQQRVHANPRRVPAQFSTGGETAWPRPEHIYTAGWREGWEAAKLATHRVPNIAEALDAWRLSESKQAIRDGVEGETAEGLIRQLAEAEAHVMALPAGVRESDPRWQEMQQRRAAEPTPEGLSARAVAYMASDMAMTEPTEDQEQNWILGHLCTFAHRELDALTAERDRLREALVAVVSTSTAGCWCDRSHDFTGYGHQPKCLQARAALTPPPSTGEQEPRP